MKRYHLPEAPVTRQYKDYDKEKWIKSLKVGHYIWNCAMKRVKIIFIGATSGSGDRMLEFNGGGCSARHCATKYKWS